MLTQSACVSLLRQVLRLAAGRTMTVVVSGACALQCRSRAQLILPFVSLVLSVILSHPSLSDHH
jgi:hypothetical protein